MKSAKWWMGMLAAVALVFGSSPVAMADTEMVDGVKWTYTVSGGEASVGTGEYSGARAVPESTTGAIAISSTLGGNPVSLKRAVGFRVRICKARAVTFGAGTAG
ncbi:MAG: hypothetical protein IKQ55_04220 [Kiritimatiellae bacterium]|nr:hypothetical protein [Kiritimatiellia bacterium]